MSLQPYQIVALEDIAVLGECCPAGRDLSLKLLCLGFCLWSPSELRLLSTQHHHTDGITIKTDNLLNDQKSEIERDLSAFGFT